MLWGWLGLVGVPSVGVWYLSRLKWSVGGVSEVILCFSSG